MSSSHLELRKQNQFSRLGLYFKFAAYAFVAALVVIASHVPAAPEASAPRHVLTWAHDGWGGGQTDGATQTSTNPTSQRHIHTWLSFAEIFIQVNHVPQKGYYDCSPEDAPCRIVIYYDPVKLYANCAADRNFVNQNTSEDYYLHDSTPISSSNRTMSPESKFCNHSPVFYPNWNNPAVGQWFARNYLWPLPENSHTIMFQDDSNADCRSRFHVGETYAPVELQEGTNCNASIAKALRNVANQMRWRDGSTVPVIMNGCSAWHKNQVVNDASAAAVVPGSQIIGCISERQIILQTTYTPLGAFADVNTASLVYAWNPDALYGFLGNSKAPIGSDEPCSDAARNSEDHCGALQLRRNLLASFWLAYKEGHIILWFTSISDDPHILTVFPEASIYPSQPVQTLNAFNLNVETTDGSGCGPHPGSGGIQSFVVTCGTLNDGHTPAGVYVREFRRCYNFGQLIGSGQCAVVMNATNRAVTVANWFVQRYTHLMVLGTGPKDGADVLTAGCGDAQCPASVLNPLGAALTMGKTQVPAFDALFLFHS